MRTVRGQTCFVVLFVMVVAGCQQLTGSRSTLVEKAVTNSVAQQIMGEGAISVYPFTYQYISSPGIYAVRANEQTGRHTYIEICSLDMERDSISRMERKERESARTFKDDLASGSIEVATPFLAARTVYTAQSVDGFKSTTVESGGNEDAADWIMSQVGEHCLDILKRNDPFIVVVGVANSDSIAVERGGGTEVVPFNIGIANVEVELSDVGTRVIGSERVFAISGKLYQNGNTTSHGAF